MLVSQALSEERIFIAIGQDLTPERIVEHRLPTDHKVTRMEVRIRTRIGPFYRSPMLSPQLVLTTEIGKIYMLFSHSYASYHNISLADMRHIGGYKPLRRHHSGIYI